MESGQPLGGVCMDILLEQSDGGVPGTDGNQGAGTEQIEVRIAPGFPEPTPDHGPGSDRI